MTPNSTLFGFDKPLVETPRSATFVSDLTLQRYGVEEVDDLIAISPGAFTASFYGVKGAVSLRGTLAETYYDGFKRIENRGTYQTPITVADSVEILRGPPTSIYGPGKVGGFLNMTPRGARDGKGRLKDEYSADLEITGGSYRKFNLAGNVNAPIALGNIRGALHIYGEYEDSGSFYRGLNPRHKLVQPVADFDLSSRLTLSVGGLIYRSDGYVQTPGWNRLTQDLIDNGTYVTGRDTTIVDSNGDGRISPSEIGKSLVGGYYGTTPTPNSRFTLDEGVGTTKLDRRTVFVSDADFSHTETNTFFADLAYDVGASSKLRLQGFYDDLLNKRFVSYGFPAWYDARVFEVRGSFETPLDLSAIGLKSRHILGASYRDYDGRRRESYNSGYLGLDRRDLSHGATATDTFADPFSDPALGWDNNIHSRWSDAGLFLNSDATFFDLVNVMFGGRYDWYDLTSTDTGQNTGSSYKAGSVKGGDFTWNASVSLKTGTGLIPYFTYAKSSALEVSQAGDVTPGLIKTDQWLSKTDLVEAGLKFDLLNRTLVGSLSAYRQNRTRLATLDRVVATTGKGIEAEIRWVTNKNLSFTFAGNYQKTVVEGPDTSFVYLPAYAVGLDASQAAGGMYAAYNFSTSPAGHKGDYEITTIPRSTMSAYATYTTDPKDWGQAGATLGVVHVSHTATLLADPVVFHGYELVNGSIFVTFGKNRVTLNMNNILDKTYFQPAADTYVNVAALPGRGREWRIAFKRSF